jgi:hypothetical protein
MHIDTIPATARVLRHQHMPTKLPPLTVLFRHIIAILNVETFVKALNLIS